VHILLEGTQVAHAALWWIEAAPWGRPAVAASHPASTQQDSMLLVSVVAGGQGAAGPAWLTRERMRKERIQLLMDHSRGLWHVARYALW
jgi:hypothetical protein